MRVRKKPVEVEAMKLHNDNINEVADWSNALIKIRDDNYERYLSIFTLEGTMTAYVGDWIIKGVNGEFYPCKHDIFCKTYDVIETEEEQEDTDNSRFPFIEVVSIKDNDDGSACAIIDMDMTMLHVFAKHGLLCILREEAERIIKEQAE